MICIGAAPAKATTPVTYVSGKGTDSGDCSSPAKPCRTFQFAVNQTSPGGEVKALDPADYRPVTITKPISITGVEGAGIDTSGGTGIALNPPDGTTVNLANLIIQNVGGSGTTGINARVGSVLARVTITHCTVRGYGTGIDIGNTSNFAGLDWLIVDTVVTNNQTGIITSSAVGTLDHVIVFKNSTGVEVDGRAGVTAVDTVVSDNSGNGFEVSLFGPHGGSLSLAQSTATGNGTDVNVGSQVGVATSFGDNHINSIKGTLTKVPLR